MQYGAPRMNKRANILDLVLQPLFVTIVALGMVLLMILSSIHDIQSSTAYEKRFYAADAALLIDSLFALPKDANVETKYILPDFGLKAEHNTVTILPDERQNFYFTGDSLYSFRAAEFPEKTGTLLFYKTGNTVGIEKSSFNPNFNMPYCEPVEGKLKATVDYRATIGNIPALIIAGDALASIRLNSGGEQIVKIYVNSVKESEQIACYLSREFSDTFGTNTAVIPVNTQLLAVDDPRIMLKGTTPAFFIDIYGIPDDATSKAKIMQAVKKGVSNYGLA